MRLALDHHYSTRIAVLLREQGREVVAAIELGWETYDDDALLIGVLTPQRAFLTNNVSGFMSLATRWQAEGRSQSGLIFTSDVSLSGSRHGIGRLVQTLDALLDANPADGALQDRLHWL